MRDSNPKPRDVNQLNYKTVGKMLYLIKEYISITKFKALDHVK